MKTAPLQLPWDLATVPHAIVDILRGCNIRCRDCYNLQPDHIKPLSEIEAQLDALQRLRKLQSVSIVGGETTLHPNLVEIVRGIRKRGLFAEVFTNGVALNDELLAKLKQAGANVIFLHIERHQRRPDLPVDATDEDLKRLRSELAARVVAHGIEAGLAVTGYPDKIGEVEDAVAFTLESPHLCYLLVTWWRDVSRMPSMTGDLANGMFAKTDASTVSQREIRPQELCQRMEQRFALTPFAFLGSNIDPDDPRWLSFMAATAHQRGKLARRINLCPTRLERTFLALMRKLTGRYPFYQRQRSAQIGLHLLLNGLAGGDLGQNLSIIGHATGPGACLGVKRLLFQWPAALDTSGRLVHCQCCPDAVLRKGRLVPLCVSDLFSTTEDVETPPLMAKV